MPTAPTWSIILCAFSVLPQVTQASPWNSRNDPTPFGITEKRLRALPKQGRLDQGHEAWSESYWPTLKGGINYRWNSPNPSGFKTPSHSREELRRMTPALLATLAPSEKFDLLLGRYDYPLKTEVAKNTRPSAKDWAGICNGWAPASLQFPEPAPVTLKNPDGIEIPFGASDIKALISYFSAKHNDTQTVQVGARCYGASDILGLPACSDINPGAFHLILTHQIALKNEGFVADVERGNEVWNQPVIGYESQVAAPVRDESGGARTQVKTKLYYVDELEVSQWDPVVGTDKQTVSTRDLEYWIETDARGNITGGEWITTKDHPDFVWKLSKPIEFTGDFLQLKRLTRTAR